MGQSKKGCPSFVSICEGSLEIVNGVCFGTVLGILWVEIVICISIEPRCDKMSLNSLY